MRRVAASFSATCRIPQVKPPTRFLFLHVFCSVLVIGAGVAVAAGVADVVDGDAAVDAVDVLIRCPWNRYESAPNVFVMYIVVCLLAFACLLLRQSRTEYAQEFLPRTFQSCM